MTEDKGFEIHDKRHFASEEPKTEETVQEDAGAAEGGEDATATGSASASEAGASGQEQALPQVNFATFIVSLSSSVFVYLGEIEDPATGQKTVNLPVAKQTIDILAMLEEKTKGNLAEDEENLLKSILYDLRMRYVALAKK